MTGLEFTKAGNIPGGSILSMMTVDVVVNENSKVCILHDRPFPFAVDYIEFNEQNGDLFFISRNGSARNLGMPVPRQSRERLSRARCAYILLVQDRKAVTGYRVVPLVHKNREITQ